MRRTTLHIILLMMLAWVGISCVDDRISDNLVSTTSPRRLELSTVTWESQDFGISEIKVDVDAQNTPWTFEQVPDWLRITPMSGDKGMQLTAQFSLNTGSEREATFYLVSTDTDWPARIPVKVKQAKNQNLYIKVVDLGLSVKWADMNLGASKPEWAGGHYAWGEVAQKESYSWSNYKYGSGPTRLTRYCLDPAYGTVDNDSVLNAADDAATFNLGEDWRMPTANEFQELMDNGRWVRNSGFYRVYSKISGYTDKYIDIPDGLMWASNSSVLAQGKAYAYQITENGTYSIDPYERYLGYQVRPVTEITENDITGISVSRSQMTMAPGEVTRLSSVVMVGSRSTNLFTVNWASDNENVLTVNESGHVKAVAVGTAKISASVGSWKAECSVTVKNATPEYVDLGLTVRWATFNVGAAVPEGNGYYLAWGETAMKDSYTWDNYKYQEDDAATVNWGSEWRTPTWDEFYELISLCSLQESTLNGVPGYRVTSNVPGFESNSIFLPSGGWFKGNYISGAGKYTEYWTCHKYDTKHSVEFVNDNFYALELYIGVPIRPVFPFKASDITGLHLDGESEYTVGLGASVQLTASALIDDRVIPFDLEWSSSNPDVATVTESGKVETHAVGSCVITVKVGEFSATCTVTVYDDSKQFVDLGLSVMWAKCNLGSHTASGTGARYAWGEIETKSNSTWSNYRYRSGGSTNEDISFSKYNTDSSRGNVDDKTVLDLSDDAAYVEWGDNWRMPTNAEQKELVDNCTWTKTTMDGVVGYQVTSNIPGYTDRSIFIPAGSYWSSNLSSTSLYGRLLSLSSDGTFAANVVTYRYFSLYIRPVVASETFVSTFSISDNEIHVAEGGTFNLSVSALNSKNESVDVDVQWLSSDNNVATVNSDGTMSAIGPGTCTIAALSGPNQAYCAVIVDGNDPENSHPYVDLGLSVKWATCNIGAASPEEYGDYLSWGELETRSVYLDDYDRFNINYGTNDVLYGKYNTKAKNGTVDHRVILEKADDVAVVRWGGTWRMPTKQELEELFDKCSWVWTYNSGSYGYRVTSNVPGYTDKSIFLPASGFRFDTAIWNAGSYGYYMSSSLDWDDPDESWVIIMEQDSHKILSSPRSSGSSVRPVCP